MNTIKIVNSNEKINDLTLGDIYCRLNGKERDYYIVAIDLSNPKLPFQRSFISLHTGCRWSDPNKCLDSANNGSFIKVLPGTILTIKTQ